MNRSWKLVSPVIVCIAVTAMIFAGGCQALSNVTAHDNQIAIVSDNVDNRSYNQNNSDNRSDAVTSPRPDNGILISLPFAPLVGQEVGLECTVYSDIGCDNATAWLVLPDAATALTGTAIYSGKIGRGQRVSVTKPIVFQEPGNYEILTVAEFCCYPNVRNPGTGIAYINLTVGVDYSKLGTDPHAEYKTGIRNPKHDIPPQTVSSDSIFQIVLWAVAATLTIALAIILIVRYKRKQH